MSKAPAFQFYPGDWIQDTRILSPLTRGIWIDMLCFMWRSDERGKIGGSPCQLSRVLSCEKDELWRAVEELKETKIADVYVTRNAEVTEDNAYITVINRRMFREQKEREKGRLRAQRFRDNRASNAESNAKVTPPSSSSSSSSCTKVHKNIYAESVSMTEKEYTKLLSENGEYITKQAIQLLSNYKLSSGKRYKSDYHAILTWALDKARGGGNGQSTGRPWVRQTPAEDPEVISDVEAINARFRAKQMARSIIEKPSGNKAPKDAQ